MKAALLRDRVTLQTRAPGTDEAGQPLTTWTDTADLWADVRYLSGLSAIKAGADVSVSKVSIRLRARDVSPAQRIKFGATVFAIQAVLPDVRRVFVDLVCEALS